MSEQNDQSADKAPGELAREVLIGLYRALSGHTPKAVRVYGEGDAMLLLLRFDPAELWRSDQISDEPLVQGTFGALPDMIASAVERRQGQVLLAGDLSVCAERGLAVFAFRAVAVAPAVRREKSALFASLRPSPSPAGAAFS
jgi:hypothetical protein